MSAAIVAPRTGVKGRTAVLVGSDCCYRLPQDYGETCTRTAMAHCAAVNLLRRSMLGTPPFAILNCLEKGHRGWDAVEKRILIRACLRLLRQKTRHIMRTIINWHRIGRRQVTLLTRFTLFELLDGLDSVPWYVLKTCRIAELDPRQRPDKRTTRYVLMQHCAIIEISTFGLAATGLSAFSYGASARPHQRHASQSVYSDRSTTPRTTRVAHTCTGQCGVDDLR